MGVDWSWWECVEVGGSGWEWVGAQFNIIIQNFRNIFSKSTSCDEVASFMKIQDQFLISE